MAKAIQVADALRTVADNLMREPETEIGFYFLIDVCDNNKERFLARARLMPRPAKKDYSEESITVSHDFMASGNKYDYALRHYTAIARSLVCEPTVIGTKVVPAQVIPAIPEVVLKGKPEEVIPEHLEDVIKWNCVPLLSDDEDAAIGRDEQEHAEAENEVQNLYRTAAELLADKEV